MFTPLNEISQAESQWLEAALHNAFGAFDRSFLEAMKPQLDWVRLASGRTLFERGDVEDAIYFVVAGRLRAFVTDDSGAERPLGDIRRGETVGEMALLTGDPRSAKVLAVRDSLLVRLSRECYEKVIRAYPLVSLHVARFIVERVKKADDPRLTWSKPSTIALVPITAGTRCEDLARELLPTLARHGNVDRIDSERVAKALGRETLRASIASDPEHWATVSRWIDDAEAIHDLVLLASDDLGSEWTGHCLRHADEIIWVADVDAAALPQALTLMHARRDVSAAKARQTILLRHAADTPVPRDTRAWLTRYEPDAHLHLRKGRSGDLNRLGRAMMGRSIGLVFGGGGARGFAHLGVLKALEEAGICVDHLGGCSIGSVMAAYAAFDLPADELIALARRAFRQNPTGDINLLPMMSLIKGKRLRSTIENAVRDLAGFDADIEDTWKPLFCIASNYSRAVETVLERGCLAKAIRASVSIPAALPPVVIDGDLMIDGGTFNNFPTDVMARKRAGMILGCDLMPDSVRKINLEELPSNGALALDKWRPRSNRRYRLPGLSSIILNVSILHSQSKVAASRANADVCFTPDLGRIGMLDWGAFDKAVQAGYLHAREILSGLSPQMKRKLAMGEGA